MTVCDNTHPKRRSEPNGQVPTLSWNELREESSPKQPKPFCLFFCFDVFSSLLPPPFFTWSPRIILTSSSWSSTLTFGAWNISPPCEYDTVHTHSCLDSTPAPLHQTRYSHTQTPARAFPFPRWIFLPTERRSKAKQGDATRRSERHWKQHYERRRTGWRGIFFAVFSSAHTEKEGPGAF